MTDQKDTLFEIQPPLAPWQGDSDPLPPHSDPDTSRAAAVSVKESSVQQRANVLAHFHQVGPHGATCDEVEQALRLPHQSASARIWELRGLDRKRDLPTLLYDTGTRRKTLSGRTAVVWATREEPRAPERRPGAQATNPF